MTTELRKSTDTRTGISVVRIGDRIDTCNVLGERVHTIEYAHVADKILTHRWFGTVFDEEIKEILAGHFVDAFLSSGCTKVLADLSGTITSWDGVNDWLRDELMPRLYKGGMTHLALITAPASGEAASNQFAAERFAEENPNISPTFPSEAQALAWLKAKR